MGPSFDRLRGMGFAALIAAGCSVDVERPAPEAASEVEPPPDVGPSNAPCVISLGCPEGERCDDGRCVLDQGCPAPVTPVLLYEAKRGEPLFDGIVTARAAGRDYFEGGVVYGGPPFADTNPFVDLRTGVLSTLVRPEGNGGCWGEPLFCTYYAWTKFSLLSSLALDEATQTWSAGETRTYDLPYSPWYDPSDVAKGKLLLIGGPPTTIARLTLA